MNTSAPLGNGAVTFTNRDLGVGHDGLTHDYLELASYTVVLPLD